MARAATRPKLPAAFKVQACGHTYRATTCKVCPHCFGVRISGQSNDNSKGNDDA